MKKCPKCKKVYEDSWTVCLHDNSKLVDPAAPEINPTKSRPTEPLKTKKCSKCKKTYDDSWDVCLSDSTKLEKLGCEESSKSILLEVKEKREEQQAIVITPLGGLVSLEASRNMEVEAHGLEMFWAFMLKLGKRLGWKESLRVLDQINGSLGGIIFCSALAGFFIGWAAWLLLVPILLLCNAFDSYAKKRFPKSFAGSED